MNAVNAFFPQLGHDAANLLREGLDRCSKRYLSLDRWSYLVFPRSYRPSYVGNVGETKMADSRNRQRVVLTRRSRILRSRHGLEGVVVAVVCVISSVCFCLFISLYFRQKCYNFLHVLFLSWSAQLILRVVLSLCAGFFCY